MVRAAWLGFTFIFMALVLGACAGVGGLVEAYRLAAASPVVVNVRDVASGVEISVEGVLPVGSSVTICGVELTNWVLQDPRGVVVVTPGVAVPGVLKASRREGALALSAARTR